MFNSDSELNIEFSGSDVRRAAMDLLARREHSVKELRDKLGLRFQRQFQKRARRQSQKQVREEAKSAGFHDQDTDQCLSTKKTGYGVSVDGATNNELSTSAISTSAITSNDEIAASNNNLAELIESEVSRLTEEGLQSDARLAEAYIRSRSNRGHGPLKISAELRNKGVLDSLINDAMDESGINWADKIRDVAIRKYGEHALNEHLDTQFRAKRNRFLMQRGFSFEHIAILG